jgi:hypothetical protein
MRTSLNEIKLIEEHIFGNGDPSDALLFEAMLVLNADLKEQVTWQKKAHELVIEYSRKQLKIEIASVHNQLFGKPEHLSFGLQILRLFK